MPRLRVIPLFSLFALCALWFAAAADETSSGDKLRILYSNRFTFTDDGYPLVTVELVSGRDEIRLSAEDGVVVRPDGDGGSEVLAGAEWVITAVDTRPAVIREWTVVETLLPGDLAGLTRAMNLWTKRGFKPRQYELGAIFGVDGEVIDTRQIAVAVDPVPEHRGATQARSIADQYKVETSVYHELVERPRGTVVAKSGDVVVRNPSVVWFAPRTAEGTLTLADVEVGAGGSQLETKRETRHYLGRIYVTMGKDGKLVAVNAVSADKLLAGLVPAEMYPDAPPDALAAQAIAARTELLNKIGTRHLTDPFLLCSHQHCQVYAGAGREHPRTTRAVRDTRGMVLLRPDGGLVDARYSAACGGHGEHNEHIWGGKPDPVLRGHRDSASGQGKDAGAIDSSNIEDFLALGPDKSYCGGTRYSKDRFRWTVRTDADELSSRVAEQYPDVGRIRALEPLARGVSGRIKELRITGDRGVAVAQGDLHIRRLLGGLRSSLFVVRAVGAAARPQAFEFRGAGFGHGVGMCQLGAIGMAKSGKPFATILGHYYTGSHIKRLY